MEKTRHIAGNRLTTSALALTMLALSAPLSWSATLIERGDTILVSIAEAPKSSGPRKVDADGRIMVPQLGGIAVAGLDLDAVRAQLEQQLISRGLLKAPTVVVEIAKYRPFYVGGKVGRPGAIDFEPGLTVRHAIILAGGLGRAQDDILGTVDVADLRAKWETASFQLAQVNSRISRLNAELVRNEASDPAVPTGSVSSPAAEPVVAIDRNILKDQLATWSENQSHLHDEMALFDLEIDVLGQQATIQDDERKLLATQVNATRALVEKGLVPLPRLQELQRTESQAARDYLENRAFAARARQSRSSVQYQLNSADIKWRIDIRQQLRDAFIERAQISASIDALSAKILSAGIDISDDRQFLPVIVIYRATGSQQETISAEMNTEIRPGDVVDVSFARGSG